MRGLVGRLARARTAADDQLNHPPGRARSSTQADVLPEQTANWTGSNLHYTCVGVFYFPAIRDPTPAAISPITCAPFSSLSATPQATRGPPPMFNSSRVCGELGMSYNGMDVMLRDMLVDMADKGLIKAPKTTKGKAGSTTTAIASPAPNTA